MKNRNLFYGFLIVELLMLLSTNCEKKRVVEVTDPNQIVPINFNQSVTYGSMSDIDGNVYKTLVIGTQTWMAENLKTTKYKDGTAILYVTDLTTWNSSTTGAYCWYDNNSGYKDVYGALYNGYTIDANRLCPANWHIPTKAEWDILSDFLGGPSIAGGKLKETGLTHWEKPNYGANNDIGFTALPAGAIITGKNVKLHIQTFWWASTVYQTNLHTTKAVNYQNSTMAEGGGYPTDGYSIRCVKN